MGEIFAKHTSNKGLNIYKELQQIYKKKTNDSIKKVDKEYEQKLFKRRHTCGQKSYEKMLIVTGHQRDANENHIEIPSHAS